jgi:hypothetical protein
VLWKQPPHYLQAGYSPAQIAGTLSVVHPDTPTLQASHETLYTVKKWRDISNWRQTLESRGTLLIRTAHGSAVSTRTPTDWLAITSGLPMLLIGLAEWLVVSSVLTKRE